MDTQSMESPTGILSTKVASIEEEQAEQTLRPQALQDYIGQLKLKEHLQISLAAARQKANPSGCAN